MQDLSYTYDPAGNITHIQDDADIQNVVFFRNRRVEPSADFTYDAIYRLIEASGREQLGLNGGDAASARPRRPTTMSPGWACSARRRQRDGHLRRAVRLRRGRQLPHADTQGQRSGEPWLVAVLHVQRGSLLNPGQVSNRLSSTAVSGSQPLTEPYSYDLHGNMTAMPQLQQMQWDFKDQLLMTSRQAVNASDSEGTLHQGEQTYYVYNAAGERVRKTTSPAPASSCTSASTWAATRSTGEYAAGGNVTLERHTLHVMDDKQRVALVETITINAKAAPAPCPSTTIRYQFGNHLGTACLELDETGAVITYEEYYPYGSTSYQAGRTTPRQA